MEAIQETLLLLGMLLKFLKLYSEKTVFSYVCYQKAVAVMCSVHLTYMLKNSDSEVVLLPQ